MCIQYLHSVTQPSGFGYYKHNYRYLMPYDVTITWWEATYTYFQLNNKKLPIWPKMFSMWHELIPMRHTLAAIANYGIIKILLPDRESNPGLPHDRRRYSPLYYRGLHTNIFKRAGFVSRCACKSEVPLISPQNMKTIAFTHLRSWDPYHSILLLYSVHCHRMIVHHCLASSTQYHKSIEPQCCSHS